MAKAVVINGSPTLDKGRTAFMLAPFMQGIRSAGAEISLYYASKMDVRTCTCGKMACWNIHPGVCVFQDEMDALVEELKSAEFLVFGVPVYIQLPSAFQSVLNRLVPMMDPGSAVFVNGRTRAKLRAEYALRRTALVAVGGWWEVENLALVDRIITELSADSGVIYAGAVLRPHAYALQSKRVTDEAKKEVSEAVKQCGQDLVATGGMNPALLEMVSRPLIPWE